MKQITFNIGCSMKNIAKKIIESIVLRILLLYGYSPYNAHITMKEIVGDFYTNKKIGSFKKIKYYCKGFLSAYGNGFNVSCESDLSIYVPEIKYFKCHPINGMYSKWIDDKLTIRHMMSPFNRYFPEYYFQINDGMIFRLVDCPEGYTQDISGLIHLLKDKGELAAKLTFGSKGIGFYKLSYSMDSLLINDAQVDEKEFHDAIIKMDNYILTEYITSYADLKKIFPKSSNTIRIMVINDGSGARVTGAFIRFGTIDTGYVDNVSAGGIFCGVDITNGTLFSPCRFGEGMELLDTPFHPDTGEEIKGRIRNWQIIVELLVEIGHYLPQICYMGYDIIVTDKSFKIIEINSLQGLDIMQFYYPLMKDDITRKFFEKVLDSEKY